MVKLIWTKNAIGNLRSIYDYIALDSPASAKRVRDAIFMKTEIVTTFPEIGFLYKQTKQGDIRTLLYGHYRVAYLLKDQCAEIIGVYHTAMNLADHLKW